MAGSDPAVEAGVAAGQQASALGRGQMQKLSQTGQSADLGQLGLYAPSIEPAGTGTQLALTANRAHVVRLLCPRSMTVKQMSFAVGVAASVDDQVDLGIYTANLQTMLAGTGPVSGQLLATGRKVVNLLAPINLVAGSVYYLALAHGPIGGTAAQLAVTAINPSYQPFGGGAGQFEQGFANGAFPLPAPLPAASGITNCPVLAVLQ
jgi:hypothetical protein